MLDIKFIREYPDKVKQGCVKKQAKVDIDELLKLDKQRREIMTALDEFRAKKNKASKDIVAVKDPKDKKKIISEMQKIDKQSDKTKKQFQKIDEEFNDLLFQVPNMPFDEVPVGESDKENVVSRKQGEIPKFDFKPKDHLEIGQALDLFDIKKASEVSGSRFSYFKNEAVLLEFALVSYVFNILAQENFIPIIPPAMIKQEPYKRMGRLAPGEEDERYHLKKDEIYLIGSAEHTIGPLHMDEIFAEKDLPKRYIGFSPCFRREAGSYGKDVKGILRSHQFNKLEMFSFTTPENSEKEHKFLLSMQEKLVKGLELPYQVVEICTGDMGFVDTKQYDIEIWIPSQEKYRETHSCSNTTDFQARGINCRYRKKDNRMEYVHMLNATAFAIGRTLIAILENYQQKDGSVLIPEVLQKYIGKNKIGR